MLKLLEEWDKVDDIFDGKPFELRQGKRSVVLKAENTAKWIKTATKNIFKCSGCKNYLDFSGLNGGRGSANYCPNCGAKMEEEK